MLGKGDAVGDLRFSDSEGKEHRLSEFADKRAVILFFYPMDFSPGCTKEACHFRDYYREICDLGGVVFGVSTDSVERHKQFKEKHHLPYPLIADANKSLSKTFGVRRLWGLLGNKRVTFVVAPDGRILEAIHSELSMSTHVERVIEVLKQLKESQ